MELVPQTVLSLKGSWRSKKRYPMEVRQGCPLQFRAPLSHFLHVTFISSRRNRGSVFKCSNVFTFGILVLSQILNFRMYKRFGLLFHEFVECIIDFDHFCLAAASSGSLWLSVCLSVCLSACLSVCLSVPVASALVLGRTLP